MLIDVRPILHIPGKELNFQFELDLSDMEFGGRNPISRPVIVEKSLGIIFGRWSNEIQKFWLSHKGRHKKHLE